MSRHRRRRLLPKAPSGVSPSAPASSRLLLGILLVLFMAGGAAAQQNVSVPDAEQLVGAPSGAPLRGDALKERTQQVAAGIRCPVCQGLSIADSPSEMAVNMKAQVREMLARGYTQVQIEKYFELSYGQFVLLRPKFEGVNMLVWILPIAALVLGGFIAVVKLRRLASKPETAPPPQKAIEPENPYLARVRELAKEARP